MEGGQKGRLVPIILVIVIVGLIYLYSRSHGKSAVELGSKSLKRLGTSLSGEEEADSSSLIEEEENSFVLKSIPVSIVFMISIMSYEKGFIFNLYVPSCKKEFDSST